MSELTGDSPAVAERGSLTTSDGIEIAYQQWGERASSPPVVLQHGFAVDADLNWVATGVVHTLLAAGRHVIAPDARGHGRSAKPHDPALYGEQRMARDLQTLVGALELEPVDLVGYSMGAVVCLLFAAGGARVRRLVVGGVGSGIIECGGVDRRSVSTESIIEALCAEDPAELAGSSAAPFRALADAAGADRVALRAQAQAVFRGEIALARISSPTLVLAGTDDPLAVRPQVLVDALPRARLKLLAGDHGTAVANPQFAAALLEFLS